MKILLNPNQMKKNFTLLCLTLLSFSVLSQPEDAEAIRNEINKKYENGKKLAKYFPGGYYYHEGSIGYILNEEWFKQLVNNCQVTGKKFAKIQDYPNYMPKVIREYNIGGFSIDNKAIQINTSAGSLVSVILTKEDREKLDKTEISMLDLLSINSEINFSDEYMSTFMTISPRARTNTFKYLCSCSGYVDFAIKADAAVPVTKFKTSFEKEKQSSANLFLLEGWFKSPLVDRLKILNGDIVTYLDLWVWYSNDEEAINSIGAGELYYVSQLHGAMVGYSQESKSSTEIKTKLNVDANIAPVKVKSEFKFGGENKELFEANAWATIIYSDNNDGKLELEYGKFPTAKATKDFIESSIEPVSQEHSESKAISNSSTFKFIMRLPGFNESACNEGKNTWLYSHMSGDDIFQDQSSISVSSNYDQDAGDCLCTISGLTKSNVAPANDFKDYQWDYKLTSSNDVRGMALEFESSHSETTTSDPKLEQRDPIVQWATIPVGTGFEFTWRIPIDVDDDERNIKREEGKTVSFIGSPTYSSSTAEDELMQMIKVKNMVYDNGKFYLNLFADNVEIDKFEIRPKFYHATDITAKVEVDLATGNKKVPVQIRNLKIKFPKYLDSDGDGIADHLDLCPGVNNSNNDDNDNDGIGNPCDFCPDVANTLADNVDGDGDGIGDKCDKCPNDIENTCDAAADEQ